jgi:hypothetical protein
MLISMNKFYRLSISLALAFLIAFGAGSVSAYACSCLEMMTKKHACCPEKQEEPPCPHHQKQQSNTLKQVELKSSCSCVIAPDTKMSGNGESKPFSTEELILTEVLDSDPAKILMVGSRQKPVWLRQIFYPDKSALYLDHRHLLI